MTFWPLTNSDFPTDQTFHQFHDLYTELDLHRIMNGFRGAFASVVASQQGTLTLPDTWFRPSFWDLLMLQLLRPNSSNLPCLYSTFHLEYPLVLSRFCFSPFQATFWPRKIDEGSAAEIRIWSILLIHSDFKWCIHLSKSLFLNLHFKYVKILSGFFEVFSLVEKENLRQTEASTEEVTPEDLRSMQYEVLQKESAMLDLKKQNLAMHNEKLKLEVAALRGG